MVFYTEDKLIIDFRDDINSIIDQYLNLYQSHCPSWQKSIFETIIDFNQNDQFEVKTSGTTSSPKIITAKKEHLLNSATKTNDFFSLQEGNSSLLCMNPIFIGGKMMIIRAIERKLKLFCIKPQSDCLHHLEEAIDFAAVVPLQLEYSLKKFPDQLKLIKNLIIGGGSIKLNIQNRIQELGINAYSTFGMTETYSHIALQEISPNQSSMYVTLDGVQISCDENSCLTISANHLGIKQLHTNDIIEEVPNGFIWKGRLDDMINSGGVKVYPSEIERELQNIITSEFIISSLPDETLGDKVVLILEGNQNINKEELINELKATLPLYHDPKSIFQLPEFPRTLTNKIRRKEVRQLVIDQLLGN